MSDATIGDCRLMLGDCRERLHELPDASVDCVVTDPPYPCIDRPYGRLTEAEWHDLMHAVVAECRRILTPKGSAVFVLQPNYEHVGKMRLWLWEFVVRAGKAWNLVQDAYWFNICALPTAGCERSNGLMRPALKMCVWLGDPDCYRDQDSILWPESEGNRLNRLRRPVDKGRDNRHASGNNNNRYSLAHTAAGRGGVTPFNVFPIPQRLGRYGSIPGHGATTPAELLDDWIDYLCPPGGTVLDPFVGSGTTALAAIDLGRQAIGIERNAGYFDTAVRRLTEQHDRLRGRLFA